MSFISSLFCSAIGENAGLPLLHFPLASFSIASDPWTIRLRVHQRARPMPLMFVSALISVDTCRVNSIESNHGADGVSAAMAAVTLNSSHAVLFHSAAEPVVAHKIAAFCTRWHASINPTAL